MIENQMWLTDGYFFLFLNAANLGTLWYLDRKDRRSK